MTTKRRALVLGGGGPVGVAWETGLVAGLATAGVSLGLADTVIGTSAGSITGAYVQGGADLVELADDVADLVTRNTRDSGIDQVPAAGLSKVMDLIVNAMVDNERGSLQERLAEVGRVALAADTIDEETFVGSLALAVGERQWPAGYSCTAVNAETGHFVVWDELAGVPLERAVASSCAVPGIYPPITIDGARYMDGGIRSPLNADLAAGHDVVVVVSVMPLALPAGFEDDRFQRFFEAQQAEIEGLRSAGATVEVVAPDDEFLDLSAWGAKLMDFGIVRPAVEAGIRLGKAEAGRIGSAW